MVKFSRIIEAFRTISDVATLWGLLTYMWGPVLAAWGFVAGWKEGIPTPYLLAACSLIFGCVSWGLSQIGLLLDRTKVRDNLNFSAIRVGRNIHGSGIFMGCNFASRANVPIEFDVQEIKTRLHNMVPEKSSFAVTKFVVPPNGVA
jgi:hypothetical protein